MKKHSIKSYLKYAVTASFGLFSLLSPLNFASENKNLEILKEKDPELSINNDLLKMPKGNFESASKRVKFNRNPFQDPIQSNFSNVSNLYSVLQFKGLLKSGDKLMAIIYTKDGQNLYQIGDEIGNGFLIKSISMEDITVDISNGMKNYRLSLTSYKSQL
tara:strand:- start:453 stop:932 length:480 start_codon:yes stop_codon:yes gene_type:complete